MTNETTVDIAKLLRTPDAARFRAREAAERYDSSGELDIGPPLSPVVIEAPVDWRMSPSGERSWGRRFHALGWLHAVVYGMDCGRSWSGRLADAGALLKAVVMSCVDETLRGRAEVSVTLWDEQATASRCSNLCYFYVHSVAGRLSVPERERFRLAMLRHVEALVERVGSGQLELSDQMLAHVEAIGDAWTVFRDDIPSLDAGMSVARSALERFVEGALAEDGTTWGHSAVHHAILMGRISAAASRFEASGRPLSIDVDARLRRAAAFLWSIMPRWGVLPPVGDTPFGKRLDLAHVARFTAEPWIGPEYAQWHDPASTIVPEPLVSYEANGYHVFRNGPVTSPRALYSLFLERRFRGPHGHWDGNSFTTHYGGEPFLVDCGGPYKYGDALRFRYFQTRLAHNSVVVDPDGDSLTTRVTSRGVEAGVSWVVGRGESADGSLWLRIFGHAGPENVFVVDIAGPGPRGGSAPVALFHLAPGLRADRTDDRVRIDGGPVPAQLSFCRALPLAPRQDNGRYRSRVTSADARYDEASLVTAELEPFVPQLSLLSFDGSHAVSVELVDGECRFVIAHPTAGRRETRIPVDAEALAGLASSRHDTLLIINLDHDHERWRDIERATTAAGYRAERVGGIRGLYLPALVVGRIPGAEHVARGTLGCFLSHASAWERIASGARPRGLVAEDDIEFAPWLAPGLLESIPDAGLDLVFCNRRMLEDEKSGIVDRQGEPVTIRPLIPILRAKPPEFRAPGGEGYILSRDGARRLLDLVARGGIHGDVDWFMLVMAIDPRDRDSFAPGTPIHRHCRRLTQIYGSEPALQAGIMSPWMIRHLSKGSSRKADDRAHESKSS